MSNLSDVKLCDLLKFLDLGKKPITIYYPETNFVKTKLYYNLNYELHREDGPALLEFKESDGTLMKEYWYINGKLHNETGPAYGEYYKDQTIEKWYLNNINYRVNGPSTVITKPNNELIMELYSDENGKRHREDGPAKISYNNGKLSRIEYIVDEKLHREDGPAIIIFDCNGIVCEEFYYINGQRHREDGPARIIYKDGKKYSEDYYINGKLHREDGPASIFYRDERIENEYWYINDKLIKESNIIYH